MLSTGLTRIFAILCGFLSALLAAASAPILFSWAIDSSRPIHVAPLFVSGGLLVAAAAFFVIRRTLLGVRSVGSFSASRLGRS